MAAGVEWVALTQALDGKQAAAEGAMLLDTPGRVPGARRLEPASGREQWRDEPLVDLDEQQEQALHAYAPIMGRPWAQRKGRAV